MKTIPALIFILLCTSASAQIRIPTVVRQAANTLKQGAPNNAEIILGLKETLDAGITAGSERLSVPDGFYNQEKVRVLFPAEAKKLEKTLRTAGLGKECDTFIRTLNTAAGQAIAQSKPIFVDALRAMTVKDASEILFSKSPDAATRYFQKITSPSLMQTFRPIIDQELNNTGAKKLWEELVSRYNQIPLTSKIDADLTGFVAQKAIEGLFFEIEKEELMIRRNTTMRTTPMMKRIFREADENLYNAN